MSDDNQAGQSWSDGTFSAPDMGGSGGDSFTETTSTSWFSRLKGAIAGVVIGLLLIPVSVVLLFWNEGRAVTTARSLTEGAGVVVSVSPDRVDPANRDKLVHVAGPLTLRGSVTDPAFGVSAQAVRLIRRVEMYQWKEQSRTETRTKIGGGEERVTTYSYVREWSERFSDSAHFKQPGNHHNPPMRFTEREVTVARATLGAFEMTEDTLRRVSGSDPLPVDASILDQARRTAGPATQVVDGRLYLGRDPDSPQIGDLRIRYEVVKAEQLSVVARQSGNGFASYQTVAGDQLLMVEKGLVPAAQMFKAAQDANTMITWIVRGVGALVMFIGFALFFRPLGVLADVLPILGDIIRLGTGAVGLALTAVLAPLTIAIAWFYYRPIVGILVLLAGIAVAVGLWFLGRSRRASRPMAMPPGMAPAGPAGYGMPPQVPMGRMPPQGPMGQVPPPGQWPPQQPQGQWQQPQGQWPQPQPQGQWQQPQGSWPQQQPPAPPQGPVQR